MTSQAVPITSKSEPPRNLVHMTQAAIDAAVVGNPDGLWACIRDTSLGDLEMDMDVLILELETRAGPKTILADLRQYRAELNLRRALAFRRIRP